MNILRYIGNEKLLYDLAAGLPSVILLIAMVACPLMMKRMKRIDQANIED